MNLTELITELQSVSGRLDLSATDLTKYLNQGVKFLDEVAGLIDFPKIHFIKLNSGDNAVTLPASIRSFKSVYLCTTTERTRLIKSNLHELRDVYNTLPASDDSGVPAFFAPISILTEGNEAGDTAAYYGNWASFKVDDSFDIDGFMLYPAADGEYSLEVTGNFYSPKLTAARPNNFWSVKHPDLVISAAMFKLDVSYRNTMGAKELLAAITLEVGELYHDRIEHELSDNNLVMEG